MIYEKLRTGSGKKDEREEKIKNNKKGEKKGNMIITERGADKKRRVERIEETIGERRTEKRGEEKREGEKATLPSSPLPPNMKWKDFVYWVSFYTISVQ